jgi:hypothetical protein
VRESCVGHIVGLHGLVGKLFSGMVSFALLARQATFQLH